MRPFPWSLLGLLLTFQAFWILPQAASAQDPALLKTDIQWIQDQLRSVQIEDDLYEQGLEHLEDRALGLLRYSVSKTNQKGESETMISEFHLSDIDWRAVERKTSGKMLTVYLVTDNRQKLVQRWKNGELENYGNDVRFIFDDTDLALEVVERLRDVIPQSNQSENIWPTLSDALVWLERNVGLVSIGDKEFSQALVADLLAGGRMTLSVQETSRDGDVDLDVYEFYLQDLIANAINLDVDGKELRVELIVRGGEDYIKHTRDGELESYRDKVYLLAADLTQARDMLNALRLSTDRFEVVELSGRSIEDGLALLSENTGRVDFGSEETNQSISVDPLGFHTVLEVQHTDDKGRIKEERFDFYLYDVDEHSVELDVSGKNLWLRLRMKDKQKFVRVLEGDDPQNYESEVRIAFDDIRVARQSATVVRNALTKIAERPSEWGPESTLAEALEWLGLAVGRVKIGEVDYDQELSSAGTCRSRFTSVRLKGDDREERSFEFTYSDLNHRTLEAKADGKEMKIKVIATGKEKLIENFKNGEIENYRADFEVVFSDPRHARDAISAFRFVIEECASR